MEFYHHGFLLPIYVTWKKGTLRKKMNKPKKNTNYGVLARTNEKNQDRRGKRREELQQKKNQ